MFTLDDVFTNILSNTNSFQVFIIIFIESEYFVLSKKEKKIKTTT